ncbi:DeoR/GlpR family DNA-binding transcription regulator [Hydrogenoanaerobacterium sp.]|uniref:DeoR/GlpR family DNA-binding transcription regulator n=1 Tax=Hydrogenoanaerobacterium sp. TaxID=2953763 RepID=UPI0028993D27|nr:DeoR/GlpR family DNA-binding transcription regulator [Hydrogenoanaerobacterium sp.]
MLSLQRRNEIKNIVLEKKTVTVAEIAKRFGVSNETVRRDFEALEESGFLTKTYGGAVLQNKVKTQIAHQVLESLFVEEKQRIARKCAEMIHPGECIFIDFSTTAYQICNEIEQMKITVMSNSHNVIHRLSGNPNLSLLCTGGNLDLTTFSFFGRNAVKFLSSYHLDTAFVSCCTMSMEKGLSDRNEEEAEMRRAVIENADKVFLVVDHTKLDRISFIHTCDFEHITAVITDKPLSENWRTFLRQKKIAIYECTNN